MISGYVYLCNTYLQFQYLHILECTLTCDEYCLSVILLNDNSVLSVRFLTSNLKVMVGLNIIHCISVKYLHWTGFYFQSVFSVCWSILHKYMDFFYCFVKNWCRAVQLKHLILTEAVYYILWTSFINASLSGIT